MEFPNHDKKHADDIAERFSKSNNHLPYILIHRLLPLGYCSRNTARELVTTVPDAASILTTRPYPGTSSPGITVNNSPRSERNQARPGMAACTIILTGPGSAICASCTLSLNKRCCSPTMFVCVSTSSFN